MKILTQPAAVDVENGVGRRPGDDAKVIRRNSRSFSLAARLLPGDAREDVHKLYAWCRCCDDAVDNAVSKEAAVANLGVLREDIERIYRGSRPAHQASMWLAELVAKHRIERELPRALIDGMEMDLRLGQIQTERELLRYCFHAAGVVGLMMCRVFGVTNRRAERHAKALGIAMQLTNIARDVREDWERGRCYLPKSWFRNSMLEAPPTNEQVRSQIRRVLEMADHYYEIGNAGVHYLPASARTAIRIASAVYREIGRQIRRSQLRVMDGRTIVPKSRFFIAALLALASGAIGDAQNSIGLLRDNKSIPLSHSTEFTMNDTKHLVYLGLSLTAFMGSGLFLLVMLNPKDAAYSSLPVIYAVVCFAAGIATNLLAKNAETPACARVVEEPTSAANHREPLR